MDELNQDPDDRTPEPPGTVTSGNVTFTHAELADLLRRVQAEEHQVSRFDRWVEFISAIVLALATVATAWSGYQSTLWNGNQNDYQAKANEATIRSSQYASQAQQRLGFEASLFVSWAGAYSTNNTEFADFLYQRFPADLKKATDAWIATQPRKNPNAPPSPFVMKEYVLAEQDEAKRLDAEVTKNHELADQASTVANRYVLLTVIFASVLFFGGISGKFQSQRIDALMLGLAIAVFLAGLVLLATFPVE